MIHETGLNLDADKIIRRAMGIAQTRDTYFNDIIKKFREKFPGLKIIYANDTMGATIDPGHPMPDFLLVVKGQMVSKDKTQPPKDIILVDAPMVFTDRSIAGWTLAVENGDIDGYFDYMLAKALRIEPTRFYEFIEHMALLSTDPNNDLYWKKIENTKTLTDNIAELYARYAKKGSTRMEDATGYSKAKK